MNTALIVVDAWRNCEAPDLELYPYLEQETRLYGQYLNYMFKMIRPNCQIIHNASGRPIMHEINTFNDLIITHINEVPIFDKYYFCGFHLGRCINRMIHELNRENSGIVLNMSMVFPQDLYSTLKWPLHLHDTYMYSHAGGFECMTTKNSNRHIFLHSVYKNSNK